MAACTTCAEPAVLVWQRRLTQAEIAEQQALTPPGMPVPDFLDATAPVYGCGDHSLTLDLACRIHQATCGPYPCTCTPEPLPDPTPMAAKD